MAAGAHQCRLTRAASHRPAKPATLGLVGFEVSRRLVMKSHTVPFENRWTNGEHAWQWYCELERLGVANVRTMFCEHETHHGEEPAVIFDIPAGFVRDWLAFHDRRSARQQLLWRASVIALGLVAASGVVLG